MCTYNIPSIPQIAVGPHHESHRDDLQDHFSGVNQQKHEINRVAFFRDTGNFPINSQEKTVHKNNNKDKPIKPWIDGDKLDNFVSKRVRYREAAQRDRSVILLLAV